MREILFRGKRVDNGQWVYGYYIKATHHWHNHGIHKDWIITDTIQNGGWCNVRGKYAVMPETVGQYTGLTDKNGKRIFEGDIVKHHRTLWGADNSDIGIIQWCQKTCKFYRTSKFDTVHIVEIWEDTAQEYEVIGNIYDNPELLEVQK